MLNTITWSGYWACIALLTLGYYLSLYLLYFRGDFKVVFPTAKKATISPTASPAVQAFLKEQAQSSLFPDDQPVSGEPVIADEAAVSGLMDELNAYFEQASKSKVAKAELVYALQRLLAKYPSLRLSAYREVLTNVIQSEAEHHCSIHLSKEEIEQVWLDR